jgi:hypothetical protein
MTISRHDVNQTGRKSSFLDQGVKFEAPIKYLAAGTLVLTMIAFPAAMAAATFIANMINDIFHGMMAETTPYGCLIVMLIIPGVFKLHCPSMW